MEPFQTISIKQETAKRFREFSRAHFGTHTEAMEAMLDFFLYNEISPKERLGPTGRTIEKRILKRINAVIAIIRDIEKNQTKPTNAMLRTLFEADAVTNKPLILEKRNAGKKPQDYPQ